MSEHKRPKLRPGSEEPAPRGELEASRKVAPWSQEAAPRGELEASRKVAPWSQEAAPRGENLDSVIDRVVREMMNVDADPAFRTRVMARLEHRATPWFSWSRAVLAGGAAAMMLLAFVMVREPSTDAPVASVAITQPAPSATPANTRGPAPEAVEKDPAERQTRRERDQNPSALPNITQALSRGTLVATVADEQPGLVIDPLNRIDPIAVDPLERFSIAPAAIEIAPLTPIPEVRIAPLSPQIERD